jgi:hypothetical protein
MSLETEFSEIMGELTKFQAAIGRVSTGVRSRKEHEMLSELIDKIEEARVQAETAVPAAIKKIYSVASDVQQRAEEQQKKLAELQAQIEERKKNPPQPPAAPAKPEIKFDPNLGARLSRELMDHVAPPPSAPTERPAQVIKEIWEDWNWDSYGKN